MKKSPILLVGLMIVSCPVSAIEFRLQPRIDSGVMFYEYSQDAIGERRLRISGFSISDVLPFVGGGLTLFADRWFADVSVQHGFGGSDTHGLSAGNRIPPESIPLPGVDMDTVSQTNFDFNDDIERTEYSFSAGYAFTDNFVVYAGYKRAKTEFEQTLNGQALVRFARNSSATANLTGTFVADSVQEFDYDGPFVGLNYAWRFKRGALSENVGVAFLDGSPSISVRNFVLTNEDGIDVEGVDISAIAGEVIGPSTSGDTIGVSLGLTWFGLTPVDALTYQVAVNGYRMTSMPTAGKTSPRRCCVSSWAWRTLFECVHQRLPRVPVGVARFDSMFRASRV